MSSPQRARQRHPRVEYGRRSESQFRSPGAPMGMADIAEVLWNDHMAQPDLESAIGPTVTASCCPTAGSMLLYSFCI